MANVVSGPATGYSGTVGGVTYSQQPNGAPTTAKQKNKKSDKPLTPGQLSVCMDTAITAAFIKSIENFAKAGYAIQAKKDRMNQHNSMVRYMRATALTGVYPERKIDFPRLLVSKGEMPAPRDVTVTVNEFGFVFTWNPETNIKAVHYSDQIMLLAYFPELNSGESHIGGAQRYIGKDLLALSGVEHGYVAEIYISFIANDRSSVSNSIYLGQLTW
ncbi:DUF6266 family protein [Pedobacter sp. L105]|uniref:DUF6266 family protein n=1 Tax=Pedobacter sp. L105 TaxID=1641871 RepID=UPI00131DA542|nr:DUF6266 family protein [Pedobacter sp. L105]